MTKQQEYKDMLDTLDNFGLDVEWIYKGKSASIVRAGDHYSLAFNGEVTDVESIDAVRNTKCFDGKSLNEIFGEVNFEY